MTILRAAAETNARRREGIFRVCPVTVKLTKEEWEAVTRFAASQGIARGQWMRDAILSQMQNAPNANVALSEILGVRLLLVNVLRPLAAGQNVLPETFDKLLDEISTAKHELATKILSERRG